MSVQTHLHHVLVFKGTLSRDCRPLSFSPNYPPWPFNNGEAVSNEFAEIFVSEISKIVTLCVNVTPDTGFCPINLNVFSRQIHRYRVNEMFGDKTD
jgi:hypothetical protein